MASIYIKIGKRPAPPGEAARTSLRARVLAQVRNALLRGDAVDLPGVGRLAVRDAKDYVLTHPDGVTSRSVRGARKIVFHPERSFLQALNEADPSPADVTQEAAAPARAPPASQNDA